MKTKKITAVILASVLIISSLILLPDNAYAETDWNKYSCDYYYNQMTSAEKRVYRGFRAAAQIAMDSSKNMSHASVHCRWSNFNDNQMDILATIWLIEEPQYFFC